MRRGFTLVEALVAIAIVGVLGTMLVGAVRGGAALTGGVTAAADEGGRVATARALLRLEVAAAGRAVEATGLRWLPDAAGGGGDVLRLRYRRDAWRDEPKQEHVELFADRDGAGRPNLYRRTVGAPKQPLVLGVRTLRVVGAVAPNGRRLARDALHDGVAVASLTLELDAGADSAIEVHVAPGYAPTLAVGEAP